MNIKNLFKFKKRPVPASTPASESESQETAVSSSETQKHGAGKIYTFWNFALPVLLGLTAGRLAMTCLSVYLTHSGFVTSHEPVLTNVSDKTANSEVRGMDEFLAANPFRVSPMRLPEPEPEPEPVSEDTGPKIIGSLATAVVKGTFPDVGVWLEDKGKTRLVLIGSSFDVYTLVAVSYRDAVFMKEDDIVIREMTFGQPTVVKRPPSATPSESSTARVTHTPLGDVVPAVPGKQDGAVPSELVNTLVQNPFDELKKVRLRPKDDQLGLEIQWIQEDSILSQLGVQKGDVVKAINGIEFNNMADIANSINSLMDSERFDVEVERGGKKTALRYVVH